MEPEAEDPENNDNLAPWSGSDGSQELCASESLAESYNEDDISDEYPLDPQPHHIPTSNPTSPERLQSQAWESAGEQQSLPELSGSEEDVSYQEEDDIYLSESRESATESPHVRTSVSLSPLPERPDSRPPAGQISRLHSPSSSCSLDCAADMTLALTLTTEEPLGASKRQDSGTGNRRVESSEEGGSGEAPPASVFFEIPDEGAEQAEKWNSESDTDLCRPDRHRARHTQMEALPETKGKGVLMFAQRRKRMDEIVAEQEDQMSKQLTAGELTEPECTEAPNIYDSKQMYMHADQANYVDASHKQHVEYQENIQQMNHLANAPRPLVPNRTAKPFLGFQDGTTAHAVMPGGVVPVTKRNEPRFIVPVPINTNPQVWSPTGDIIASRDERISVPAIKTGILPESKRKAPVKQPAQESNLHLQNKGDRRSYIESEEDCFSLGAEACNFMQPRTMKLKNPPPVAPKPTINPSCPPWMGRSPAGEPYLPPRSPVSQPSHSSAGPHSQHYLQQDWAQPQQMANQWAPDQTQAPLQTPVNAWAPVNSSSQLHLQPTTNSWNQQPPRSPGFGRSRSMSLPRRLNSMPSPCLQSPVGTPGPHTSFQAAQRQTSFQENVYKPLSPWEAASRSPLGSVDEAFVFQSLPSSVASNVKAAGQRRSLPEPPDEWKRRVSLDPPAVSKSHYHAAPAFQAPSLSRTFSPEKPGFCGPPFRPAQPLRPASRSPLGYMTSIPSPANPPEFCQPCQSLNVTILYNASWREEEVCSSYLPRDAAAEKLNITAMHKSYHSPWEEAILRDPDLAETLKLRMPELDPRPDLPEYKCFNRVATPFGGFEKAPRGITFKLPEVDLNPPRYPELQEPGMKRPTFNRTAQGWISEGTHLILPTVTLEPTNIPESDDL
ncbi:hypothetical protein INR49_014362 [Caranx melampygus]|nr:hypothetical protein INR49_014362 [Caranx melampygus]